MILNLTPHAVQVMTPQGQVQVPPHASPARLRQLATAAGWVDVEGATVELFDVGADGVEDLPAPQPDVWLVVSRMVAEACPDRRDLVFPYREVRDPDGRVIGCSALGRTVPKEH